MSAMDPDEEFWSKKLAEGRQGQLEAVRKAATTWSGLFSAILATFGTVAFAGGLPDLGDLDPDLEWPVKIATLAAGALMILATILASRASGNFVETSNANSWQSLQRATNSQAETAASDLTNAKRAGAAAAAIVLLGSAAVLLVGEAESPSKKPPTVVAVVDGTTVCGKLERNGDALRVDGTELTGTVTSVVIVDACP